MTWALADQTLFVDLAWATTNPVTVAASKPAIASSSGSDRLSSSFALWLR